MSKRVFISKHSSEIEPIRSQLTELGFTIEAHSFLAFSPVEFEIEHPYDVIFFGSPRAVIFFQANYSIAASAQVACIGEKTAELVRLLGREVSFIGENSGEPTAVAEEFRTWLGDRRAFFPISDRSLKTIASTIPEDQREEGIAYSTSVVGKLIGLSDHYVFTSPTNVEGFFEFNELPSGSKVIAWGKSTEAALISRAASVDYCLKDSSLEELLLYLKLK